MISSHRVGAVNKQREVRANSFRFRFVYESQSRGWAESVQIGVDTEATIPYRRN